MDSQLLWSKASAYCARAEHCEQELRQKIRLWSGESEVSEEDAIIDRLYEHNFLNEERYCRAYAHDKLRYSKWGKHKIIMMLRSKGLSSQSIEVGIQALPMDEYEAIKSQLEASKRRQLGAEAETYEGRMKLLRFMASHGF